MENINNTLYYIVAGEASGDLHGFRLMQSFKKNMPNIAFKGVGGPKMKTAGLKSLIDFKRLAVMGFLEVIKDLFFFLQAKKSIINDIKLNKPEKIILIDYPGFNLSLAESIKKNFNIPVFFYISPQVWAWKEQRFHKIKKYIDELIVIFPFEVDWFKKRGVDVQYFGHPLIDVTPSLQLKKQVDKYITIGLFPGSRKQEIKKHLPLIKKTMTSFWALHPETRFVLCKAPGLEKNTYRLLQNIKNVTFGSNSQDVFSVSDAAIVTSGTATLECAISNTPFVVIYKTSFISWFLAKRFLLVPWISIVNILANKKIVQEFLQHQAKPKKIALAVSQLLENKMPLKNDLLKITKSLGHGKAYDKAINFILNY